MGISCLHSHLLPNIDDGVKTIDESLKALAKACKEGIHSMVLTPHYIVGSKYSSSYSDNLLVFNKLCDCVRELGIDIKLYLGNEVYFDDDIVNLLKENIV